MSKSSARIKVGTGSMDWLKEEGAQPFSDSVPYYKRETVEEKKQAIPKASFKSFQE
jgi:hypothetical protein